MKSNEFFFCLFRQLQILFEKKVEQKYRIEEEKVMKMNGNSLQFLRFKNKFTNGMSENIKRRKSIDCAENLMTKNHRQKKFDWQHLRRR